MSSYDREFQAEVLRPIEVDLPAEVRDDSIMIKLVPLRIVVDVSRESLHRSDLMLVLQAEERFRHPLVIRPAELSGRSAAKSPNKIDRFCVDKQVTNTGTGRDAKIIGLKFIVQRLMKKVERPG